MQKFGCRLLLLVFLFVPLVCSGQDDEAMKEYEKGAYGKYFTPVTSFGYIYANRYHSGSDKHEGEEVDGFDIDQEMTDFLQLRFKNNFADIPYEFVSPFEWAKRPEIGNLRCAIWLHGASYPIAYHVECKLGTGEKNKVITDATLGITSNDGANKVIKEALDRMVSKFALTFFRVRGEL